MPAPMIRQFPATPLAASADRALQRLAALSGSSAIGALDGNELLMERAWLTGARFSSGRSTSGATRLLGTADGVLAITLARPDDWALVPAWLEDDDSALLTETEQAADPEAPPAATEQAWQRLTERLHRKETGPLLNHGRQLGLPLAATGAHRQPLSPDLSGLFAPGPAQPEASRRPPRVIDLSALWAGPLCSHLLHLCGAEVIKVESSHRPDGARNGHPGFYDLLNQGKRSVALDLNSPDGIRALVALIDSADLVIESSRPRALRQLGMVAEDLLRAKPALIWISLTGYGRTEPQANWTAFGDDAGVAAGLSDLMCEATGTYQIAGDAIADPLTGVHAALAAWQAYVLKQGGMIELALTEIAAWCLNETLRAVADTLPGERTLLDDCRIWWEAARSRSAAANYRGRPIQAAAAALGADTRVVLEALSC